MLSCAVRSRNLVVCLITALAASLAVLAGSSPAFATASGTWRAIDVSATPYGPISLADTGDLINSGCDDCGWTAQLPFASTWLGTTSQQLFFNSNGWMRLGTDVDSGGALLDIYGHNSSGNPGQDLFTSAVYLETFGVAPHRQAIIDYHGNPYGNPTPLHWNVIISEGVDGARVVYDGFDPAGFARMTDGTTVLPYAGGSTTGEVVYTDAASDADVNVAPAYEPGVDTAGYHAVSSANGAPYGFVDLTKTGKPVFNCDDCGATTQVPFDISLYGTTSRTLGIDSNASLAVGGSAFNWSGNDMPRVDRPDSVVVYGRDLFAAGYTQMVGTAPNRQYIVEWVGSPYGSSAPVRVEATFFEGKPDILFQYDAVADDATAPIIGLNKDGVTRLRYRTPVAAGTSLGFTNASSFTGEPIQAPVGGSLPDAYGYRAISSLTPGGPEYSWIDASDGDQHLQGADDAEDVVSTPFPVSMYGADLSTVHISSNGCMTVGDASPSCIGTNLPDASRPYLIVPFGTDLVSGPAVFTKTIGSAPHRSFIVEWESHFYGGATVVNTEVVFREDSSDILMQYKTITDAAASRTSVVGIGLDASTRLIYSTNGAGLTDGTAILFTTDPILSLATPLSLRTDGLTSSMTDTVVNVSDTDRGNVREDLTLDGLAGLTSANTHVEMKQGDVWTPLSLAANADVLSSPVGAVAGQPFLAGSDLSVPLRISVDPGAPTGTVHVSLALHSVDGDGNVVGTLAKQSRDIELIAGPPDAPAISTTRGDHEATVAWTPASNGGSPITGWTVTGQPGDISVDAAADATSALVSGLTNGTSYTFHVVAHNALGDSVPSSGSPVTPAGVPQAPSAPSIVSVGNTTATVGWTAPNGNGSAVTSYTVTAEPGDHVVSVDAPATQALVTGLTNGTDYTVTVTATNAVGTSVSSAALTGVTPHADVPGKVQGLTVGVDDAQASLAWTAPADGGAAISGYHLAAHPVSEPDATHDITSDIDASTTSGTMTGLSNGTAYAFSVAAINVQGVGAASDAVNGTPHVDPVTGLVVSSGQSSVGADTLAITWTPAATSAAALVCVVQSTTAPDSSCTGQDVNTPDHSLAVTSGIAAGKPYTVAVWGRGINGHLSPDPVSMTLSGTTLTTSKGLTLVYGKSTTLKTTLASSGVVQTDRNVTLWSKAAGTASYKTVKTVTTVNGVATVTGLKPTVNTVYQWRFAGAGALLGTSSGLTTVKVAPILTNTLTPSTAKVGKTVYLWGSLNPSHSGSTVVLQQLVNHKWKSLSVKAKIAKQRMPNGKTIVGFKLAIKAAKKGSYTYRAWWAGDSKQTAAAGSSRVLKVS